MPARYAPVPNPRAEDAEREMADAFALDDEENEDHTSNETTPLTHQTPPSPSANPAASTSSQHTPTSISIPGAGATAGTYDFEREYDFPPPGSPPRPSDRALPNDYGNSNGVLPTSPVERPEPRQPSLFQRMLGTVLPARYSSLPTGPSSHRPTGAGIENDGVFANVVAKPQRADVVHLVDGTVHIMPEETQKDVPPSYLEAQADAVPTYWETTVHAPAGYEPGGPGEVIVEDLPTGTFLLFCINAFISFFFQFVGFFLTYLLHTSHAAKYGSRAGLGLTLIQYGFTTRMASREAQQNAASGGANSQGWIFTEPNSDGSSDSSSTVAGIVGRMIEGAAPSSSSSGFNDNLSQPTPKDWLSFLFMTIGWFLFITSFIGFWRVKRWEHSIRNPQLPPTPEQIERDRRVRQTLEEVFGVPFTANEAPENAQARRAAPPPAVPPSRDVLEEARLTRDLHAAGLL